MPPPSPSMLPRSTISPVARSGIGCFLQLSVEPINGVPTITQGEAEARERASAAGRLGQIQAGQLGALLEARAVTVIASGEQVNGADTLRGRAVWLLIFAFMPRDQQTMPPVTGGGTLAWRTYALVDAHSGASLVSCTSPALGDRLPISPTH